MRGAPRGITLAELLVAAFLAGIVLLVGSRLLVPSLVLFHDQSAGSQAQQSGLLALHRVQAGLLETLPETVTAFPDAVSYQPLVEQGTPYSSEGTPLLAPCFEVVCYDADQSALWIKRRRPPGYDFSDNTVPLRMKPADLSAACIDAQPGDRVYRDIHAFQLSDPDGDLTTVRYPLSIRLTARVESSHPQIWELASTVTPRNTRW